MGQVLLVTSIKGPLAASYCCITKHPKLSGFKQLFFSPNEPAIWAGLDQRSSFLLHSVPAGAAQSLGQEFSEAHLLTRMWWLILVVGGVGGCTRTPVHSLSTCLSGSLTAQQLA